MLLEDIPGAMSESLVECLGREIQFAGERLECGFGSGDPFEDENLSELLSGEFGVWWLDASG